MRGQVITATYRVVTPMFLAGADQTKAELRLPSIKGALQFWWRALAYSRHNGDLEAIHTEEAEIWGSTKGQSKVLLRLEYPNDLEINHVNFSNTDYGAKYLAYGADQRNAIQAPFEFSLHLQCHPNLHSSAVESIKKALETLGLFGGIGSKARKGYGSLNLIKLNGWEAPKNQEELKEKIISLLNNSSNFRLPQYSAFSENTRFRIIDGENQSAFQRLNQIGEEIIKERSYGRLNHARERKILGNVNAEMRYQEDHDTMYAVLGGTKPTVSPQRSVFGLPQNYFFSGFPGNARDKRFSVKPENLNENRRASPLFFHIHQTQNEQFFGIILFIKAQFLPDSSTTKIKDFSGIPIVQDNNFWEPIESFLKRFGDQPQ